jgi:hypothetical protein
MTTLYRVQKDVTPLGFPGRAWRNETVRGNRTVAERVALALRVDGRRLAPAVRPTFRVAPARG